MLDELEEQKQDISSEQQTTAIAAVDQLKKNSADLVAKIITETDIEKTKDLAYLFNIDQAKRTMVRMSKLNDLYDAVTDLTMDRVTKKPDELTNQEVFQALKTVQEIMTKSQQTITGGTTDPTKPLIQINQPEVNIGVEEQAVNLTKASRENVTQFINSILKKQEEVDNIVDAEAAEITGEEDD